MDFKNILEGARPFFQGLPQPMSQTSPANSETASTNAKEKDATGNRSHNHNQAYHPSVITNHSSGSALNRNGNNAALPYSGSNSMSNENTSDGSMNNNNNNNKSDKDSIGESVCKKNNHSVNSVDPSVVSKNPSNSSGKSGSAGSGASSHPLLHGGFANALPHSQRSSSSQSHVPIHVPLTIPLPTHHQERSISRPKYEEGLGATLSQMYAGTLAGSRGSSQGRHMNGAPTGLLQTAPPINTNHGVVNNVSVVGGGGSGSVGTSVASAVSKNMGGTSVRRESPLDLSVKTVRQSADSSTPLEIPTPSSGMNGSVSGGGARSLSGSSASTPNMLLPTMNQLHYPLHSLSEGHSSVTSATGSTRPLTVGDTMNSVIAAVANSTTGVGLSSNESRSSSTSGRGRSREKSHERENSSSRSRTSTPTGSSGALRYPSPAHMHRQQSPSGTASPHLHQRVSTLQLNIPNPTPPPRTGSGSSVNSVSAGVYNPSSTPQPLHPSPAGTPGASTTPHHMYSQHPYAPSPIPPGAASTVKGIPPGMPSYHSHYPGIPTPSHHPSQTNSSSSGSQHSNGVPPSSSAVPPTGSNSASTVSSGSHHSQQSKHNSTIPPYNPPPPNFGTSLNSGYPPPSAHHHQSSYSQYHQYPPHHVPPPSHTVPPQSHTTPLSHHPHHAYYSSVYGHHSHLQQPPPIGAPHQRNTSSLPPAASSVNTPSSAPHGSGTSQSPAPGSNSSTPTPSSAHSSQYLPSKHSSYAYPPSTQPSQPLPSTQASATTHSYYHWNPSASSYYTAPHQTQQSHGTSANQIPAQSQSRPASASSQHHATAYPSSHYGHSQNPPASTTPYSHSQQHLYPGGIPPLNYPTYVPQAQRTQAGSYPAVQQGYPPQSSYYQGPPSLRPSTPTGPPPPQQVPVSYPTAHPPSSHASTPVVVPPGKGSPLSAEASDMKPPQNPSTSGKSPKSRKNLLHMLRNSVENRMSEKQDKDKFQFNHQTWNFHGKKYNTTIPQLNNASNNGQIPPGGVASPGGTGFSSRPGSPSAYSVDALKNSTGQQSSKYESGSSSHGGGSSTASSTHGNNAGSEGSSTSGVGSLSDSSHYNRIRTKAEKKQLFPNLLSQIEQENSHKEAEKLLQQQQQHQQQYLQSGNFYVPPTVGAAAGGGHGVKGGSSSNTLNSSSSKHKLTNSTSVFDFRDEDEDLMGSKKGAHVSPPASVATGTTTIPPIAVPEGKPLKKPRSPKKAAEPGAGRNSLPKASKGEKLPKKVKQTPQQQQELMAAVIDSVAAASSHAAAAEAHKKYLDSLKNKDLSLSTTPTITPATKEPYTLATPLRIPNPSAIAREIAPPLLAAPSSLSSEKDAKGTTTSAPSSISGSAVDSKPTGTSSGSKSAVLSTALESMDVFLDVCDSFLDDLQSNPVSIKSRRGGLWQKLKEKAKPKAGDGNNGDTSAPGKVRKGRAGPRLKKNSSEEDSDFTVEKSSEEDDEEEDEDESEHSDKSDSEESNSMSDASGKGSNSGDSSGIQRSSRKGVVLKKKKKRVIESEDDDYESGKEDKDAKASGDEKSARGRNGSRSVSSKKRSVSKATSKAESSDVGTNKGSSRRGSETRGKGETARGRSGGKGGAKGSRRRSARKPKTVLRNKSGISSLSDLDEDEDATSRTSIGSESDASVDSDSEASSFDDSSMSDDSDSNGLSGDSDSEEDSDGQSFTSSRKRKKSMTTGGKKAKRARLSKSRKRGGKDRKSRKTGKNKAGTKRTRSSSTKNRKPGSRSTSTNGKKDKENIHDSEFSDDDSSVDIKKSRSLRSRSRGQKQGGTRVMES